MDNMKKKTASLLTKIVEPTATTYRWPPSCFAFLEQPERPKAMRREHQPKK